MNSRIISPGSAKEVFNDSAINIVSANQEWQDLIGSLQNTEFRDYATSSQKYREDSDKQAENFGKMVFAGSAIDIGIALDEAEVLMRQILEPDELTEKHVDPQSIISVANDSKILVSSKLKTSAEDIELIRKKALERHLGEAVVAKLYELNKRVDELLSSPGMYWPIPTLLSAEQRAEVLSQYAVTEKYVESKTDTTHQGVETSKHLKDVRNETASEDLGLYFAASEGVSLTEADLAEALYGWDSRDKAARISCISSLISAHEKGKHNILSETLTGYGLVLQRGVRIVEVILPSGHEHNNARKRQKPTRNPIFRSVKYEFAESMTTTEAKIVGDKKILDTQWKISGNQSNNSLSNTESRHASNVPEIQTEGRDRTEGLGNSLNGAAQDKLEAFTKEAQNMGITLSEKISLVDFFAILRVMCGQDYDMRSWANTIGYKAVRPDITMEDETKMISLADGLLVEVLKNKKIPGQKSLYRLAHKIKIELKILSE